MPDPRHLRNAPITEALFDFRVKARPGFRSEELLPLQERLTGRFPKREDRHAFEATLEFGKNKTSPPAVQNRGLHGYFFKDAEEKTIAQFRIDGFTFNRLHPYTSWDELFPQALELWRMYAAIARPEVLIRFAVRYINRIPLPSNLSLLSTHLRIVPNLPPELPQEIVRFLTRITISDPETKLGAHISQALETRAGSHQPILLLDIDAFTPEECAVDDPGIPGTLGQLRNLKNRIFFNSLTDEALRPFE